MTAGPTDTGDDATQRRAPWIEPGRVLAGRYEVRRLLGRGGMGEVWLAFDLKLRVDVALKNLAGNRNLELARREVRAARAVMSPNVCRIFDLVEADGRELVSMEYIEGITLRRLIEEKGPLAPGDAGPIATQFLAGLEAIHAANLIHRDLKPDNVMITRTGRVVIMDFGLARETTASISIAGTPAYMAPEQIAGQPLDVRADVYAAGLVLNELIAVRSADNIWSGLRRTPPPISESPWADVLRKAVAEDREARFDSARELARALEQVGQRDTGEERQSPYPGLSAFTAADAKFFFGREAEIDAMLRKLERLNFLSLIGPSGAGKSSFLQAGVIPLLPKSWGVLYCHPGASPFTSLGQALAPELTADAVLARDLVAFHDPPVALALMKRWRNDRGDALIIIDQFEELFTLNPRETQASFAELIGRLVDADIRVLVSIRDDFLFHCHEYPALAPLFLDITPLATPTGQALRRALVGPAFAAGYRLENEQLADEIRSEIANERGALPLGAFAMSRLWALRDRERRLLTRAAYDEIGGVAGALAQHAEATLDRVGQQRIELVRELFRNLVTAQGTRASQDREELLSIFPNRADGSEILSILLDARLLTSYELPDGGSRVEIIHESLLTAWPRLVRWRTQDADGAVLRDQLRQSAQLWVDRGQSEDLLWSGAAFRELELWRERYQVALTETEAAFARATITRSRRARRRRRIALAAALIVAVLLATVMAGLWRKAAGEANRAEAQKLIALGQVEMERYPTAALAYFTASLERADSQEARLRVMEALWKGPPARLLRLKQDNWSSIDFHPNGKWLAFVGQLGDHFFIPSDGSPGRRFDNPPQTFLPESRFTSDGLLVAGPPDPNGLLRVYSAPQGALMRTIRVPFPGPQAPQQRRPYFYVYESRITTTEPVGSSDTIVQSWPAAAGAPATVGRFQRPKTPFGLHPSGSWLAVARDGEIYRQLVADRRAEKLWQPSAPVSDLTFDQTGHELAGATDSGFEIWNDDTRQLRTLRFTAAQDPYFSPHFMARGSYFVCATSGDEARASLWNLRRSESEEPLSLRVADALELTDAAVDPAKRWAAVSFTSGTVAFWSLTQPHARVFKAVSPYWIHFTGDDNAVVSCGAAGGLRLFSMSSDSTSYGLPEPSPCMGLATDRSGNVILAGSYKGPLYMTRPGQPLARKMLPTLPGYTSVVALDASGTIAAASSYDPTGSKYQLRVLHLDSGAASTFEVPAPRRNDLIAIIRLAFAADGTLYSAGVGGIRAWDIRTGMSRVIYGAPDDFAIAAMSGNGRYLIAAVGSGPPPLTGQLLLFDLTRGTHRAITTHGRDFQALGIDDAGTIIATHAADGVVRVGPASGAEPHLLLGLAPGHTFNVAISHDGKWLASATGSEIRVWPMPDLSRPPLHTLPRDPLVSRLHALTNLRVVRDAASPSGYKLDLAPFPGWNDTPSW